MEIAVDAMGGDYAPQAVVEGAVRAVERFAVSIALIGDQERIGTILAEFPQMPDRVRVVHASQVIAMDESPGTAMRRKPDASIMVAADLVSKGEAAGVVSAGNSGAVMAVAALKLGTTPGVERPAIATLLPGFKGWFVLLDAGANTDCSSHNLCQFARMGNIYAQRALEIDSPRVAVLSIGQEPTKGNELIKETHALLQSSGLNFVGNIEGNDLVHNKADVVVCDGFTGNVVLKVIEAFAELFGCWLKEELSRRTIYGLGKALLSPAFENFQKKADYAEYGGALLLGVNGVCVISHGRSSPKAVANAIRVAKESVEGQVVENIVGSFQGEE